MRFSVITITKNNPDGFQKTKQSIELQTYSDFEWIIIDGDKEPDNGIYHAMNKGIERARGEHTIFMNAGDEFASPDILRTLSFLHADFIYGDAIEGGFIKRARHVSQISHGMITHHQAMIYKTDLLKTLRFDESYSIAADYKLTFEFIKISNCIYYINLPLCIFETGGVSCLNAAVSRHQEVAIRAEMGISSPFTPYRQWAAHHIKTLCPSLYRRIKFDLKSHQDYKKHDKGQNRNGNRQNQ